MKNILKLDEAALFILSIYLFALLGFKWWLFPLLLFIPDLSMIGYALNKKIGAYIYNFFHHRAFIIPLFILGGLIGNEILQLAGIILFAHSAMDRMFGIGLKYSDDFKHTHLGEM